jgi:glycosyltransferase involved in cell wall biosynthesis
MKLLIVSDLPHYLRDGRVVGWGTTVREINHLAQIFEEIRYVACFYPGPAPASALPYDTDKIKLIPLPPSGGKKLRAKLDILRLTPLYLRTIYRELSWADVVHVRCPNNIGLVAMMLLSMVSLPQKRWVKYAGNWKPTNHQPWSYDFQRWWLEKGLHRGIVTVNGNWPDQPPHIYTIPNPSLTEVELEAGRALGEHKHLSRPLCLLYVGMVSDKKGAGRAVQIARELLKQKLALELHMVGDGPERSALEAEVREEGLSSWITFHGWFPKTELSIFYRRAHFLLLPSVSEGWPNVISEALAHGVVPLAGAVSVIPQLLREIKSGQALDPLDINAFVQAMMHYTAHPERWKTESLAGLKSANLFTYRKYLDELRRIFANAWGIEVGRNCILPRAGGFSHPLCQKQSIKTI